MHLRALLLFLAVAMLPLAGAAQEQRWVEGVHYHVVDVPYTPPDDGSIEVVELFWYGCGTCFQFEPYVERWLETIADDVRFIRHAPAIASGWRTHARAYYTAEVLDVVDDVHSEIFRAIHVNRNRLDDPGAVERVFTRHADVDSAAFRRAWEGFAVETRLRRGDQMARRYQARGVPTMIVAGRYRTGPGEAQGLAELMQLVDHLVELERGGPGVRTERPPQPDAPAGPSAADPAPAADERAEPVTDERGAVLWWLWLVALLVVAAVVAVVVLRGRKP